VVCDYESLASRMIPALTLLVAGGHVRVVAEDGSLLRELTLDPQRDYQPLGTPCGRPNWPP
jgi:hypothetical protein